MPINTLIRTGARGEHPVRPFRFRNRVRLESGLNNSG